MKLTDIGGKTVTCTIEIKNKGLGIRFDSGSDEVLLSVAVSDGNLVYDVRKSR